jgi:hypothetical protein
VRLPDAEAESGEPADADADLPAPQRQKAFMRPSVEEFTPTIREELDRAIRDTLNE